MPHSDVKTQPKIVTRFAPSPTGFLHIGGARTALFNALFARAQGGSYLLRIEDTDRQRSTPAAIDAILEGLAWLGLSPDAPAIFQSHNQQRHVEIAHELQKKGAAYYCPLKGESLEAEKEKCRQNGHAFRSPFRDKKITADEGQRENYAQRFRIPDEIDTVSFSDAVRDKVEIQAEQLDDLILLRGDGTPTYMLAVVVDDHDMGVTHIIRGEDHLINMARQIPIYQAMGWPAPECAHLPLIHGEDGKKLSKRHGSLGAESYRAMGYLAAGLRNYLLRLGWAHGDEELIEDARAETLFSLDGLQKSPARLDLNKLDAINAHHMASADDDWLIEQLADWLKVTDQSEGLADLKRCEDSIRAALPSLKLRAKHLAALWEQTAFLRLERPFTLTGKTAKPLKGDGIARLKVITQSLEIQSDWSKPTLQTCLEKLAEELGGMGKVGPPLRASVTAGHRAPDLVDILLWLGREETLARAKLQLS